MAINLIIFILLVIVLCGSVWFWIKKNPAANASSRRYPSGNAVMPVKHEQSQAKPPTPTLSANVPAGSQTANEPWRDWCALSTTIIAVIAVIMSLESSRATMMAVHDAARESNQWLLYQAKGIKEYSYQIVKAQLELQVEVTPGLSAESAEKMRKAIKRYDEEIKRYKDEKEEIMQEALAIVKAKDKRQKLASGFNASLAFLMVAVLLASIANMMRKKYIWYIGLAMLPGWLYFLVVSF